MTKKRGVLALTIGGVFVAGFAIGTVFQSHSVVSAQGGGTVDASVTVGKLIDAIVAAGGPRYDWRSIDPVNDKDGGEPGGNIRQVFLFNPAGVTFVDRPGGDANTAASYGVVPGGSSNQAGGLYSLAAGRRARIGPPQRRDRDVRS